MRLVTLADGQVHESTSLRRWMFADLPYLPDTLFNVERKKLTNYLAQQLFVSQLRLKNSQFHSIKN